MSSDSDDDCYGNMSQKLQKMKDKFEEDKPVTLNLLDDSTELDEIVKNCGLPAKNNETEVKKKNTRKRKSTEEPSCSVSDLPNVSVDINNKNTKSKRVTRSSANKNSDTLNTEELATPTRSKSGAKRSRGRRGGARGQWVSRHGFTTPEQAARGDHSIFSEDSDYDSNNDGDMLPPPPARGRRTPRRGRGTPRRGRRGRRHWWGRRPGPDILMAFLEAIGAAPGRSNTWDPSVPTYSVGNTEDYPDQSNHQALFSNTTKKNDEVVVVEEEALDDNEELSVKVYWQSSEFFKFSIRKYQKITQIFDYFAKKENVSKDKLLFLYNERILKPDDTPDSIEYSIVKFIDGGIVTQAITDLVAEDNEKIKDGIELKFQCQNMKKPFEITVRLDDKLSLAMMKCSEHLEKPLDKLRFDFDGDSISGKLTARELEFEGGECIDVRVLS